jgi:hypothetical protein
MATETPDPLSLPWRTGRRVLRTVYAQGGPEASREDVLIGVMDTPELAAEACAGHNERLAVNPAVGLLNAAIREMFAQE